MPKTSLTNLPHQAQVKHSCHVLLAPLLEGWVGNINKLPQAFGMRTLWLEVQHAEPSTMPGSLWRVALVMVQITRGQLPQCCVRNCQRPGKDTDIQARPEQTQTHFATKDLGFNGGS